MPARWPLAVFQVALFALAARELFVRRKIERQPVLILLALAVAWGLLQIATHRTVYEWRTWDATLDWFTNLAAFFVAWRLAGRGFLRATLIFAFVLSIAAT